MLSVAVCLISMPEKVNGRKQFQDVDCLVGNESKGKCVSREKCSGSAVGINARVNDGCDDVNKVCCTIPVANIEFASRKNRSPSNAFLRPKHDHESSLEKHSPFDSKIHKSVNKNHSKSVQKFKNHQSCGLSDQERIHNGRKAAPAEFPFYVTLKYESKSKLNDGNQLRYYCGGSLISGLMLSRLLNMK
jgi:hypothetical protein